MLRGVALAESLQALFPPLDASDRRLSLAIYGRLADGRPVDLSELCREMDLDAEEMARRVYAWEQAVRADVITGFCHYVHFFSSERTAAPWLGEHPRACLLPLSEAFEVGRLLNHRRYGAALESARTL